MAGEIVVEGLRDLQRAFKNFDGDLSKELKTGLARIAEPVRARAEQLAQTNITNIGQKWSLMRVGITARTVYVAPAQRRTRNGSSRKNLAPLLMDDAMQPALDENQDEIAEGVSVLIDDIADGNGF